MLCRIAQKDASSGIIYRISDWSNKRYYLTFQTLFFNILRLSELLTSSPPPLKREVSVFNVTFKKYGSLLSVSKLKGNRIIAPMAHQFTLLSGQIPPVSKTIYSVYLLNF